MMKETEEVVHMSLDFLPLKSYANIVEGNALRIDWNDVVPKDKLNYIMGNPPFVGASMMTKEQKKDITNLFVGNKKSGNLDYVSGWYFKAAEMMFNGMAHRSFPTNITKDQNFVGNDLRVVPSDVPQNRF